MNEHNANRIAVFDPTTETMVEYTIPSRNTSWADCEGIEYCGISQVFGFTVDDKKIWFTEWVENNIGVVDTSIPLPFTIDTDTENIVLERRQSISVTFDINPTKDFRTDVAKGVSDSWYPNVSTTSLFNDLSITSDAHNSWGLDTDQKLGHDSITVWIAASDNALPGTHKVLFGAYNDEIAISKFITVTIE